MAYPIRVGVGGWEFEPWDETFYPIGLPKAKQLGYMSRTMTAIEVNATYYSSFKPETFARWAEATPDDFVFSLKAHRFSTVRKTKEDMKKSVDMFLGQGIVSLKHKLGPINWQFPATRNFDPDYFRAFLSVLPSKIGRLPLRHALEVRGTGFDKPEFYDLLTKHGASVVYVEDAEFPKLRHEGAEFVIARLMQTRSEEPFGYPPSKVARLARLLKGWAKEQEIFAFMISGAKEKNPAAARALQEKLGVAPPVEAAEMWAGLKVEPRGAGARSASSGRPAGPRKKK